jgi:hypothetical protein
VETVVFGTIISAGVLVRLGSYALLRKGAAYSLSFVCSNCVLFENDGIICVTEHRGFIPIILDCCYCCSYHRY